MVGDAARVIPHVVRPTPEELVADLDALIAAQDEPFGSTSIYAQYRVFALAKQAGIKVMLDGQGADELLAGYRPFLATALAGHVRQGRWLAAVRLIDGARRLPGMDLPGLCARTAALLVPSAAQAPLRRVIGRDEVPTWLDGAWFRDRGVDTRKRAHGTSGLRAELRDGLVEATLPALLRYEDRSSMAHSIESRVPFLTPRFADLVLGLPEDHLIAGDGTTKAAFRAAMRGLVPDAILDRKDKIGFATPERRWLTALAPWVDRLLAGEVARALPVLHVHRVTAEWRAVRDGRGAFDFRIWRWLNLIRWVELRGVVI
jgi:asparagine synthase (glutamine-hydrolysing)